MGRDHWESAEWGEITGRVLSGERSQGECRVGTDHKESAEWGQITGRVQRSVLTVIMCFVRLNIWKRKS